MVFSSASLSLLDFPLDIRAAMEKALARDESCGFGDEVYSMSVCKKAKIFPSDKIKAENLQKYRPPVAPSGRRK